MPAHGGGWACANFERIFKSKTVLGVNMRWFGLAGDLAILQKWGKNSNAAIPVRKTGFPNILVTLLVIFEIFDFLSSFYNESGHFLENTENLEESENSVCLDRSWEN